MELLIFVFLCIPFIAISFYGYKVYQKRMYLWLPSYIVWSYKNSQKRKTNISKNPIHVMFLVADHFEPGNNNEIVKEWVKKYPEIAQKHRDADGQPPKHTWFYPSERAGERIEQLKMLSQLVAMGFGEIELHLHHKNDTEQTLRKKLNDAKQLYNKIGALITVDEKIAFGFVHGDWALDNSVIINNENKCGVNNELTILKEEGCYADFTFPALNSIAQPKKINSIYYAIDDPLKPKSYNTGMDVSVNVRENLDNLMIIQGPLTVGQQKYRSIFYPIVENGAIEGTRGPSEFRVDEWIKANIHVKGKQDWIFLKTHTHGAHPTSSKMFLDGMIERIYSYLESKYNDGTKYCLHYVTAREAYNIIKAAEDGLDGNPNQYRDYKIKPYKNSVMPEKAS